MKALTKVILFLLVVGLTSGAFAADVHVVITEKPTLVRDGDTGQKYKNVKGYCTGNPPFFFSIFNFRGTNDILLETNNFFDGKAKHYFSVS